MATKQVSDKEKKRADETSPGKASKGSEAVVWTTAVPVTFVVRTEGNDLSRWVTKYLDATKREFEGEFRKLRIGEGKFISSREPLRDLHERDLAVRVYETWTGRNVPVPVSLDVGGEPSPQDWDEIKKQALEILYANSLDTPERHERHLAYVRKQLSLGFGGSGHHRERA